MRRAWSFLTFLSKGYLFLAGLAFLIGLLFLQEGAISGFMMAVAVWLVASAMLAKLNRVVATTPWQIGLLLFSVGGVIIFELNRQLPNFPISFWGVFAGLLASFVGWAMVFYGGAITISQTLSLLGKLPNPEK